MELLSVVSSGFLSGRAQKDRIVRLEQFNSRYLESLVLKTARALRLDTGSLSHVWPQEMLLKVRLVHCLCIARLCVFYV